MKPEEMCKICGLRPRYNRYIRCYECWKRHTSRLTGNYGKLSRMADWYRPGPK